MRTFVLALSLLTALPMLAREAQAQPCCWGYGYRVRYYRVQPYYQYPYYAPPPPLVSRPPRHRHDDQPDVR